MEPFSFTTVKPLSVSNRTNSENFTAGLHASGLLRLKLKRRAIHAISQSSRPRSVGKNVSQVRAALIADNLFADHAVTLVDLLADEFVIGSRVEARPAAAAVELCLRGKQFGPAAHAAI